MCVTMKVLEVSPSDGNSSAHVVVMILCAGKIGRKV